MKVNLNQKEIEVLQALIESDKVTVKEGDVEYAKILQTLEFKFRAKIERKENYL